MGFRSTNEALEMYLAQVDELIAKTGLAVIQTWEDTPAGPLPFAYSVGLTLSAQHPELIMTGAPLRDLRDIINTAATRVQQGERFTDGSRSDQIIDTFPVVFRTVRESIRAEYLRVAESRFHDRSYEALQIVFPDQHGRFPWEVGYLESNRLVQPELW